MATEAKSAKPRTPRHKSGGGTLIGMFIGLVLGVCLAAGVVWYMNRAPLPFAAPAQPAEKPAGGEGKGQPVPLPGKPGDPVAEQRFQFYDILPGKADAIPDKAGSADSAPAQAKESTGREAAGKTPMYLQAGSFSTPQDADNQKAKLAFMGVEASVQQVMVEERTFYRVRLGPYRDIEQLNKVRAELSKSGIEAQLAK